MEGNLVQVFNAFNSSFSSYLLVSILLFFIGIFGLFFNRRSLVSVMISIEIMLLAAAMNFIVFSRILESSVGHVFVLFILAIAAVEAAIGLALLIANFKITGSISIESSHVQQK